jgi:excinuclease UvrABC ATPase subunit
MTVEDALAFYQAVPVVARKLQTLVDVGLSYIGSVRTPPRCPAARRSG